MAAERLRNVFKGFANVSEVAGNSRIKMGWIANHFRKINGLPQKPIGH
jgi:hypothetical protein